MYVAVPFLWTVDVYGLYPRIYEWSVTALSLLTPAKVLLHRVYLFSQTNFVLLFLLRSLEDQDLNSSVSFI